MIFQAFILLENSYRGGIRFTGKTKVILFLYTSWYKIQACQTKVNLGRTQENLVFRRLQKRLAKTGFKPNVFHFLYSLSFTVFTLDTPLCLYILQGNYHSPSTQLFITFLRRVTRLHISTYYEVIFKPLNKDCNFNLMYLMG
jgi:hypothetical protein